MEAWDQAVYVLKGLLITSRGYNLTDLPMRSPYLLEPGIPSPGCPTLLRPPFVQTLTWWYRNINLFPIDYAFQPRLRGRLTLRGLTLLRNPWAYGDKVFHLVYRYSCQHTLFCFLQHPSRVRLHRLTECSPTRRARSANPQLR